MAHSLLPTPAVNDMGAGRTVEDWDTWTDEMKQKHGNGNGHGKSLSIEARRDLGPYQGACDRWVAVLNRPAPAPTMTGNDGRQRLNPVFVEWMMGLPEGWVTDAGVSVTQQLKILGNGVVPQQALLALMMLSAGDGRVQP